MKSYKDLKVYEKSYKAAKAIYLNIASKFPKEEKYGLISPVSYTHLVYPFKFT